MATQNISLRATSVMRHAEITPVLRDTLSISKFCFNSCRLALVAVLMLLTTATAWANESYRYYDTADGTFKNGMVPDGATVVTANASYSVNEWGTDGNTTWYVIQGAVTTNSYINLKGTVNVVVCDGATLTVKTGLRLRSSNTTLNIYAQSDGTGMGAIVANGTETYSPAIGVFYDSSIDVNACTVNIHGGKISATGGNYTAGIGGASYTNAGTINIYGGDITAQGGNGAAGIGSGKPISSVMSLTAINIYGGKVNATGGTNGAGIGGGGSPSTNNISGGAINIYGGQITARSNGGVASTNENIAKPVGIGYGGGYNHKNFSILLSWTDADHDFIDSDSYIRQQSISSYNCSLTIDPNHPFKLAGTTTDATTSNINGQKIVPAQATVYTVSFNTGGGSAIDAQNIVKGQTATQPGTPVKQGYRFLKWQLSGSDYNFSTSVTADITLTAVWTALPDIQYVNASNVSTTLNGSDYYPLEPSYTTINGGTWVVMDDATTFANRIIIQNNVTLILTDGKTLTAQKGISVTAHDNAVLTILAQSGGTGTLSVTGVNNNDDASIGGDFANDRYGCGTVKIYGGHISTSGKLFGAGIGGAGSYSAGGTISILGGQVDIYCGTNGSNAIGYGDGATGGDATAAITLGWTRETDYIHLHPGYTGYACYKGTVTLVSNFLLNGTTTKARWTSESDNNIDGRKLVPNTTEQMDWTDVATALTAGGSITLTNDVSSESGDQTIVIPENVTASLDLNGHTLTHNYATTYGYENVILLQLGATLTISDGSTAKTGRITGNIDGLYNAGTLTITGGTFSGFGGKAISNIGGTLSLTNVSVTDNSGDAFYNNGGTLSLTNVSVTDNSGGAFLNSNDGTLSLTNVSVTDNSNGGIENYGTLNLAGKVTVTDNTKTGINDTYDYNLFLSGGSIINLTGALTDDSRIRVNCGGNRAITSGANGKAVLANFISDATDKYICWTTDGTEVQLNQCYYMNERDGMADLVSRHQGEIPVRFTRSFTDGVATTICLPFQMNSMTYQDYGTFYRFVGVDESTWTVTMEDANKHSDYLAPNTPYLFMPKQTSVGFEPYDGSHTIASIYTAGTVTQGDWTFTGTYDRKQWDGTHNTDEIGHIYGFAAQAGMSTDSQNTAIEAGKFFRVAGGPNSYIVPFRAYMQYTGTAHAPGMRLAAANGELPAQMTVRLIGADGQTTAIGTLDTRTGQFCFDSSDWYTLDGRKLSGKPTQHGVYINNGKMIVIK